MTSIKNPSPKTIRVRLRSTFETLMALLVLLNYLLVIFNLTYIPLRDFWLQGRFQITLLRFNEPIKLGLFSFQELQIPPNEPLDIPFVKVVSSYDTVKGIKPYRITENYLATVEELEKVIDRSAFQSVQNNQKEYLESQKTIDNLLAKLRQDSIEIINTNPFQMADKTGILEKIKNKMRQEVFKTENVSSKEAFTKFWSRDYLTKQGFEKELQFFDREIKPLIETNYFRPIGEDGRPIDNFEAIDFLFFLIFLPEFLLRTWWISRTHKNLRWFEAMLWRWYDVFLLIPVFRWLRIIPTAIRLDQVKLINLNMIRQQINRGFIATIAEEITEVIVIRIINQLQAYVRRGGVRDLLSPGNSQFVDLNEMNETVEIAKLIIKVTVEQVLPQITPEAEALIKYNVDKILSQTPAYQNLLRLPGMKNLQVRLSDRISRQLYKAFTDTLQDLTQEDQVFEQLLEQLVNRFRQSMRTELQAYHNIERLESLLITLLEEIKLNYLQNISQEDLEIILEQTRQLQRKNPDIPQLEPTRFR